MSVLRRVKHEVFLDDPAWTPARRAEKALVRRLDIFFCSYLSLSAIVKYLDQNNISNAYVSGMKEDLGLYGNQYNYFTTYFNIGYIITIPLSTYFMNTLVRPSLWMPTMELLWGICTGTIAAVKSAEAVYGIRFLIGFCEGTAWPGTMVLLLSWYKPSEIGKRLAIYQSATSLGGIFAGFLQSALYTNMNGVHGLSGWRWLFVINSVISVVIAGWGYFGCPDYPHRPNPRSWWLRPEDTEASLARVAGERRALPKGWTWGTAKGLVSNPLNWAIWACYEVIGQATGGTGYFNLWLKSLTNADGGARYTTSQVNLKFASFLILNLCGCYANLVVAWIGDIARHSAEERSALIAALVITYYAIAAGAPVKIWPAAQAPHYTIGWKYSLACFVAAVPAILLVRYLERRAKRRDLVPPPSADEESDVYETKSDPASAERSPVLSVADVGNVVPVSGR
ncbi:hypothetical protein Q5752_000976 [Cryptotrichosporon argae]